MRIGTWNLENLFRPGGDSGPRSDQPYQDKLAALANTISEIRADVLAVQEVGDPEALDDLVDRLGGMWYTAVADPDDRGIRVGFLSRFRLANLDQVSDFPSGLPPVQLDDEGETAYRMGRPALKADVEVNGGTVALVTCHLKSKLLTYPGGRFEPRNEDERVRYAVYALGLRAAEAATVRAYATQVLDNGGSEPPALVVLGDLNDGVHAATTTMLNGPPGSEIGTRGYDRADRGDAMRLWNCAPLIPEDERFSRVYQGRKELIDHILVSHSVLSRIGKVGTVDTRIGSVTDNPNERRDTPASDHRPVFAALDV